MTKHDLYTIVFVTGVLFIPARLMSSSVPYGVPTAKLAWLMITGSI